MYVGHRILAYLNLHVRVAPSRIMSSCGLPALRPFWFDALPRCCQLLVCFPLGNARVNLNFMSRLVGLCTDRDMACAPLVASLLFICLLPCRLLRRYTAMKTGCRPVFFSYDMNTPFRLLST